MLRRFTQRAQRAIIHAQEEARNLGHPAVGTEHILLGLIREGEGVGAKAILALGVDLETVRNELKKVLGDVGERKESATSTDLPITPRAKKVLNLAFEEARLQ
ncbi:MAG TPA: Clp protease N-terminal domain-containing protein, partial [Syntrophothermus lipocalidus]|nr:Clp protease N-terminal domain-containing protein [Syntrophothermus lipocalidus]